ncbi:unnamed protein product [Miscanthus lutarioriparius]|uniref:Methyltransferase n=1 Tax=Miscanthus lutarioriparius TaxID=422564 RepID=A0A811QSX6_9POAL|nr:unnamed protein product [Miscanthus lutarioriparius]
MERDVPIDPVPAEETTRDDPPPVTQQLPRVTDSMDGENQQEDVKEQVRQPDQQRASEQPEVFPSGSQAELFNETPTERGPWQTKIAQSNKDAKVQTLTSSSPVSFSWALCNVDAGADYIPCLDNLEAIKKLRSTKHYEHQERDCPEKPPTCLVPPPEGYRNPIRWPKSRDQEAKKDVAWGKQSRVVLDVGCGVASFGGYLFDRDVITMSFAPKDEHEAQVQFALERGIPAISAVKGTKRLPFPSRVFDVVHCERCRVPWHIEESQQTTAAMKQDLKQTLHSVESMMILMQPDPTIRGSQWPESWPLRLEKPPYWLRGSEAGVYGKPAPEDFQADYEHWKRVKCYGYESCICRVRRFAAALRDLKVWVMNVVPIDSPDTLPIIYERGLFGLYHDWCESFSTYPRTYDLLHANHLFSKVKKRCELLPVIVEVDRVLRPEGRLIVRDNIETISELENIVKSLHWEVRMSYSQDKEGLLFVQKTTWRPNETEAKL